MTSASIKMDASTLKYLVDAARVVEELSEKRMREQSISDARNSVKESMLQYGPKIRSMDTVENRSICGPIGEIPIRIYSAQPRKNGKVRPVAVFFHGGGWVLGDLDAYDNVCRYLATEGNVILVSVDYRLAPENKFPAAPEDCYAALCWVAENACALGVDSDRLAVVGDSAGGNLAAAVTLMAHDRGGPVIASQALICPVCSYSAERYPSRKEFDTDDYFLTEADMQWFWNLYLNNERDGRDFRASPLLAPDFSGLPATLVITCYFDPLRDEGKAYADRLMAAGSLVTHEMFESTIHGFTNFSDLFQKGEEGLMITARYLSSSLA